jgi:hypothetical protein
MKRILTLGFILSATAASVYIVKNWTGLRTDYELLRADWAISRTKSWRLRLEPTDPKLPKEWMVIEAIPPDREHGWQHVDRAPAKGNLEYIRIGDDRYFRGDAMFGHQAAPQWIKLIPRDFPPLDGFFELRLHLTNPRTIGYSFDSVETSLWANYHGLEMRVTGLKTYSGHTCREWSYTWKIKETGQIMHDTLCLGISDHLPYHLTTSGGWAEATYEWNPRVSVDVPDPVVSRPKSFIIGLPDI